MEKEWEMKFSGEDTEFRHTSVIKYSKIYSKQFLYNKKMPEL